MNFVKILIISVTLVVVAVPEGEPHSIPPMATGLG
jgi:hypothetical protein